MTRNTVMVPIPIKMEINTSVNTRTGRDTDKVSTPLQVDEYRRGFGKMVNSTPLYEVSKMKRLFVILVFVLTLLVGNPVSSADLQKGLDTYVKGDYVTSLRELKPLAEQGNDVAQYVIGTMYFLGKGVPKNYETTIKWYRLSAKQGNPIAQLSLGEIYQLGRGVPQNYMTAVKWYRLSAEQGNAVAQYKIGAMYQSGSGVSQNFKTAVKWYGLSAEQGDVDAQFNLGLSFATGKGIPEDYVRAHMWMNIARSQGSERVGNSMNLIEKLMYPTQLETAQRLASECEEKNYKGC